MTPSYLDPAKSCKSEMQDMRRIHSGCGIVDTTHPSVGRRVWVGMMSQLMPWIPVWKRRTLTAMPCGPVSRKSWRWRFVWGVGVDDLLPVWADRRRAFALQF